MIRAKKFYLLFLCIAALSLSLLLSSCEPIDTGAVDSATGNGGASRPSKDSESSDDGDDNCTGDASGNGSNDTGDGAEDECPHSYREWSDTLSATCTESGYAHRTCSLCNAGETKAVAALGHTEHIICERCKTVTVTIPELSSARVESFGMTVDQFDIAVSYGGINNCTADLSDLFITRDENGKLLAYGCGVLNAVGVLPKNSLKVSALVENDTLYMSIIGTYPVGNRLVAVNDAVKADVSDAPEVSVLYEILKSAERDAAFAERAVPRLISWYGERLLPLISDADGIKPSMVVASESIIRYLNSSYTVTAESDGARVLHVNYAFLNEVNSALSEKSIAELLRLIFGDVLYGDLTSLLSNEAFYSFSVSDLLNFLQIEEGVDPFLLLDATDELIDIMSGGKYRTLEALLLVKGMILPKDFDISDYLTDERVLSISVMSALQTVLLGDYVSDDKTTPDVNEAEEAETSVKRMVGNALVYLESTSLYTALDVEDMLRRRLADFGLSFDTSWSTEEIISELLTRSEESVSLSVRFDASGIFDNLTASFTDNKSLFTLTITENGTRFDFKSGALCHVSGSIFGGNGTEANDDAIISARELIDKAPSLTPKILYYYFYMGKSKKEVMLDETASTVYVIYESISESNGVRTYNVEIHSYALRDTFGVRVSEGCDGILSLSYLAVHSTGSITLTEDEYEKLAVGGYAALVASVTFSAPESEPISMHYNTVRQGFRYDVVNDGHSYPDEGKEVYRDENCTVMRYECDLCGSYYELYLSKDGEKN